MKTIKDNSYDIVRLMIYQLGISIFALVLYTSLGDLSSNNTELRTLLWLIFSVLSTLFYWVLLYLAMWELGAKDRVKIDSGKLKDVKGKGFILSLTANLPNFLFAIVALISLALHLAAGSENSAAGEVYAIFTVIMRFIATMYIGVAGAVCPDVIEGQPLTYLPQTAVYLLAYIITVVICQVAYSLGKKNFRFISKPYKKKS